MHDSFTRKNGQQIGILADVMDKIFIGIIAIGRSFHLIFAPVPWMASVLTSSSPFIRLVKYSPGCASCSAIKMISDVLSWRLPSVHLRTLTSKFLVVQNVRRGRSTHQLCPTCEAGASQRLSSISACASSPHTCHPALQKSWKIYLVCEVRGPITISTSYMSANHIRVE